MISGAVACKQGLEKLKNLKRYLDLFSNECTIVLTAIFSNHKETAMKGYFKENIFILKTLVIVWKVVDELKSRVNISEDIFMMFHCGERIINIDNNGYTVDGYNNFPKTYSNLIDCFFKLIILIAVISSLLITL